MRIEYEFLSFFLLYYNAMFVEMIFSSVMFDSYIYAFHAGEDRLKEHLEE